MQPIPPMANLPPEFPQVEAASEDEIGLLAEESAKSDDDEDNEKDPEYDEQEDGSVIVRSELDEEKQDSSFDENMAEWLDSSWLDATGRELCELVESDKEARSERDKQYADGIKRTGLVQSKGVGADFDGASSVTSPMLAKGCVDFASRAIKELFPASGPVRTQIIGDQTDIKLERAERKKTYMNWQFTEQVPEHRPEFEKMLSQLPLGGSQYKRWWYDAKAERPRTAAVYIDDLFLPYDQNDFYTTPRLTHREFLGRSEFNARTASGLYIETAEVAGDAPNRSESSKAARDVEGVDDDSAIYVQTGGTREMYTIYADLEIEDDDISKGELSPYILHVSEYGGKIIGVFRNWKEDDKRRLRLHWIVEYTFIPWRGAYGVGLAHLIGSMSVASTGALNALLDAAHINNFPGGLKLKGGRTSGQTISVNATELREIDAPPGVDDIRKLVMAFPFNGPSTVLYTLLEWLTQQADMVVSTASEKIADAGANMPMGTALALIEGGSTNFSAIHARLHHSARRELEIVHRLNATYLNDEETIEELGELVVYRKDFQGPMDILPVSDPNIFSEAQRYAQLQAVMQLEAMPEFKPFFKPEKLLVRALRLLQVPYAEDIANLPRDPRRMSPVDENASSADSDETSPLKVYEEQDDLSHLESHVIFMTSPLLGASALVGPVALPKLLKHCREHLVAYYRKHHDAATKALKTISSMQGAGITDSQAQSKGHAYADQAMAQALSKIVAPGLEKAVQLAQQFSPKPPADGNTTATLAATSALKAQELQWKTQSEAQELQWKTQSEVRELQWKSSEAALDRAAEDKRRMLELQSNQRATDMATAIEKMQAEYEKQIAMITLRAQQVRDSAAQDNARMLAEMKQQSDASLLVLKQMLADNSAANQPPDIGSIVDLLLKASKDDDSLIALKKMVTDSNTSAGIAAKEAASHAAAAAESVKQQPDIGSIIAPLLMATQENAESMISRVMEHSQATNEAIKQLSLSMQDLQKAQTAPRTVKYVRDKAGNVLGVASSIDGQTLQ